MKILPYTALGLFVLLTSCSEEYLDKKPNKSIVVPSTLADYQALLDNTSVMNVGPAMGIIGSDDLFTTDDGWEGFLTQVEKNGYTWQSDIFKGERSCADWTIPYQQVFYANVVLDGLEKISIKPEEEIQWENIKGSALFFRAHAFYQLAQLFCRPINPQTADASGIPLRLAANVSQPVSRASLKETYDRIIHDLKEADLLLPAASPAKTRPIESANKALLARVLVLMGNYAEAEQYATKVLEVKNVLIDYNTLNKSANRPISKMNTEVLFHGTLVSYLFTSYTLTYIDTLLYGSYDDNDLRKSIFFRQRDVNRYTFKGNYTGNANLFGGISINEVYLIRAECRARLNNTAGALQDLNTLLEKRWKEGTFVPVTGDMPENVLARVLEERRKELVFSSLRWPDLRRLNLDSRYRKTLYRRLKGVDYTLPPNDPRYVYPIPPQEIDLSNLDQNPR